MVKNSLLNNGAIQEGECYFPDIFFVDVAYESNGL